MSKINVIPIILLLISSSSCLDSCILDVTWFMNFLCSSMRGFMARCFSAKAFSEIRIINQINHSAKQKSFGFVKTKQSLITFLTISEFSSY